MAVENNSYNKLYTPILKWKLGEHEALSNLHSSIKESVYPCIEIRTEKQHAVLVGNFDAIWEHQALADYASPAGLLDSWRVKGFSEALQEIVSGNLRLNPVINPFDQAVLTDWLIPSLLKQCNVICLRVRLNSLPSVNDVISNCAAALAALGSESNRFEIILDLGETPTEQSQELVDYIHELLSKLNDLNVSRLSLVSGAYPMTLKAGSHRIPRYDRLLWEKVVSQIGDIDLGFGDYTIVPATWEEEEAQRAGNISVRYALEHEWLILKGNSGKKEESINLCKLLVQLNPKDFRGPDYSYGDKLIADKANTSLPDKDKKGGTTYQIIEGVNHHITLVVKEQ